MKSRYLYTLIFIFVAVMTYYSNRGSFVQEIRTRFWGEFYLVQNSSDIKLLNYKLINYRNGQYGLTLKYELEKNYTTQYYKKRFLQHGWQMVKSPGEQQPYNPWFGFFKDDLEMNLLLEGNYVYLNYALQKR